jgi:excinuclease UvrABC ATPase subunit
MEESRNYDIKWIRTARYLCKVCGVYASTEDFQNDEPCRSCNGTRLKKEIKRNTPVFPVRYRIKGSQIRSYDTWTVEKIEAKRKQGFIVEILKSYVRLQGGTKVLL